MICYSAMMQRLRQALSLAAALSASAVIFVASDVYMSQSPSVPVEVVIGLNNLVLAPVALGRPSSPARLTLYDTPLGLDEMQKRADAADALAAGNALDRNPI